MPKPDEGLKRAKIAAKAPRLTRLEQLKRDGGRPQLPPDPAPHITGWLIELGLTEAAGMDRGPLSWREIAAWQASVHLTLAPWETRLLRRLSNEYVAEARRAESENCPPPWRVEITQAELDAAEARLRSVLD